jgi:hypothetical protein
MIRLASMLQPGQGSRIGTAAGCAAKAEREKCKKCEIVEMTSACEDCREKQIQQKDDNGRENCARQTDAEPCPEDEEIDDKNEKSCEPTMTQCPAEESFHDDHQEDDNNESKNARRMLLLSREQTAGNVVEQGLGEEEEEESHSVVSAAT